MANVRPIGRAIVEAAPLRALRAQVRAQLKSAARTCYEYAALLSSLLLLCLICLSWSVVGFPLYLLLPQSVGRRVGRYGIMAGFRVFACWLSTIGVYRLDLSAIDALRGGPPVILAPNHPSLIDAVLILTRHPNLACVMKSELMANVLLGPGARFARYIRNDSTLQMVREAVTGLRRGEVLLLFPEGTRTVRAPVNPLKKSVAVIARQARVPVQTVIIETDSPFLSKGWSLRARPSLPVTYRVRLGKRFDPPQDLASFMRELEQYYGNELQGGMTTQWLGTARH
jgi:1-acyl-sn-glycerol-3-phosphate acyltransferase